MIQQSAPEIIYSALTLRDEINDISSRLEGVGAVFGSISLPLPRLSPSELGFIRVVSWLYVHYFESGKLGTEFLTELVGEYSVNMVELSKSHRSLVQRLRTYCQHNLDPSQSHSKEIRIACEQWFNQNCGTRVPRSDEHWETILRVIILDACAYLGCLRDILRCIETDAEASQIINQWTLRISRFHAPHEFDELITEVAADFGREGIDPMRLRKRYYDRWRKEFEVKTDNCDFHVEARKLIEHVLLSEQQEVLPITGKDIMEKFSIAPGPRIKEILLEARQIYNTQPCNKEALLEIISQNLFNKTED
ncbi:hypothetical protein JYG36_04950 [Pseudomonas sp. SORT22]|uniref:hypothetical protein n=1 Tax=Pseudomonas sp. SORT22 TaxID=2813842 RepID=UPI001BCACEB8|nr:hypothetical protein [Pseudomonas sp. SORT22]QVM97539.1 hypothetical protein JYG36_04950 [Pseudomonas sp. SORT22]